jgi:Ca-activated chloride channel family protein
LKQSILLLFIIFLSLFNAIGQIEFLQQPYDYGLISSNNQYVDVPVKNISNKKVFIFRADVDRRFQVHYSSKTILPDSVVYVRVQFTPTKKGSFSEKIPIHFSCFEEPKSIKITGYTDEVPSSAISCPSFSQENLNNEIAFDFQVKVIDKITREPIEKATVLMIKDGLVAQELVTNKIGIKKKKVDLGFYYFVASKEGYHPQEFPKYINKKNNFVLFELERNQEETLAIVEPIEEIPIETQEETPFDEDEEIVLTVEEQTSEQTKEIEVTVLEEEEPIIVTPVGPKEEKYPEFPLSEYKPNNIVFLIDVSASMKYTGKLDLLKASMIEMTNLLRDVDNITIVTYASNTVVEMETMSADNKDSIIHKIEGLKAKGMTAGGKGLKLAYSKACESYIAHGNNEIIMATDGAFNSGSENVYKLAKKYKSKGVKVSVIGIKNRETHETSMKKLASNGGGNYLKIDTFEDAKKRLIEEVKTNSKL